MKKNILVLTGNVDDFYFPSLVKKGKMIKFDENQPVNFLSLPEFLCEFFDRIYDDNQIHYYSATSGHLWFLVPETEKEKSNKKELINFTESNDSQNNNFQIKSDTENNDSQNDSDENSNSNFDGWEENEDTEPLAQFKNYITNTINYFKKTLNKIEKNLIFLWLIFQIFYYLKIICQILVTIIFQN